MKPRAKTTPANTLTTPQSAIVNALLYYEVFQHPLTKKEILSFSSLHLNDQSLENELSELQNKNILKKKDDFYYINLNQAQIERRIKAEQLFQKRMKTAGRYCAIIATCPFVKGVCLSGSISKGVMYEGSDIDYFIITQPNRLWVAKLLLTLFKKTVLFNSYYNFCINYFLDNEHLEIEEKNLFTATELATLIPKYGYEEYEKLVQKNPWVYQYFPNFQKRPNQWSIQGIFSPLKKGMEWMLDNRFGDFLNRWFMNFIWKKYTREHGHQFSAEELAIMFKSKPYASKVHPSNYQKRLLDRIVVMQQQFEETFNPTCRL